MVFRWLEKCKGEYDKWRRGRFDLRGEMRSDEVTAGRYWRRRRLHCVEVVVLMGGGFGDGRGSKVD